MFLDLIPQKYNDFRPYSTKIVILDVIPQKYNFVTQQILRNPVKDADF